MDDTLKEDLEAFKLAEDAEKDQRAVMLELLKFVKLGEQWPEAVRKKRDREGRPCLTINRLPAFGKQVLNDARQNRPAIKCHPVGDGADKEVSEILNGLIRNIEYTSNAEVAYDTALDFAVHCGIGYATVNIDYADADTFDKDLRIERVSNIFSVYGDPSSKAADSSDWNRAYITDKLTEKQFKKRFPGADKVNFEADDDRDEAWFEEELIRIAECWTREKKKQKLLKLSDGSVMMEPEYLKLKDILDARGIKVESDSRDTEIYVVSQRIITGAEILETNDWPGKYIPIIPCYGDEVMVENKRTFNGLFNFAMDSQRNYNYWRTATTELVALAPKTPFIGPVGAFESDADKWATANTESHPYIGFDGQQAPARQQFAGPPAGALQEALNASDDLKNIMGLHDASLGKQGNETSGRAILARQREGDTATFNFIDNQSRFIAHTGRILIDLIPKIYDVPRIVRVIKEDGSNYSVPVNQNVQQLPQQATEDGQPPDPAAPPQYKPVDPEQQQEIAGLIKLFDLTSGKYDVTVESGPSFNTRRQEASAQMGEFIKSMPNVPPKAIGILVKNMDWPGADDFAKAIAGEKDPQLMQAEQAIGQLKQQMQQMQQQLQDKQFENQIKAKEVQIKEMDAQTKMMQVQAQANQPGEAPADHSFEQWKTEMQISFDKWKTEQDNAVKLTIAAQNHEATLAGQTHAIEANATQKAQQEIGPVLEQMAQIRAHQTAPRKKVRGPDGRLVGVEINGQVVPIEGD
jgi:hypothetical protein